VIQKVRPGEKPANAGGTMSMGLISPNSSFVTKINSDLWAT